MTRAMRKRTTQVIVILILITAVVILTAASPGLQKTEPVQKPDVSDIIRQLDASGTNSVPAGQSYLQIRNGILASMKPATDTINIPAAEYTSVSKDTDAAVRWDADKQNRVVDWNNSQGWIEWAIDVPQDGVYQLTVEYKPLKGSYSNAVRGIQIDGVLPFREAETITLERWWKDSKFPYDRNSIGNEIRPVQSEIEGWRKAEVSNYAVSSEPLWWSLKKGRHLVRMIGGREPISLASLTFHTPETIPDYKAYSMTQTQNDSKNANWYRIVEAEQYDRKSAVGIQTQSVSEPYASPDPKGRVVYNAIGGDRWKEPGDWVEWQFDVPTTGKYSLDLKYFQGYNGESSAYRTIMIDGRVPFREMLHYRLPANHSLQIRPIADENGNPYEFQLEKGTHRIRFIADASPVEPAVIALEQRISEIQTIDHDIRNISGNYGFGSFQNLDTGRTWEMTKYDPQIENKLRRIMVEIQQIRDYVKGLNQHETAATSALASAAATLENMLTDINDIPNKVKRFEDILSSINSWLQPLESQAVELDYIVVRTPETRTGLKTPNEWDRIRYSAVNFTRTFFQDYEEKDVNSDQSITVWVQRGRDYVDLLQKLIEQDFTPKTGIHVNVNLMPSANVLIMSNAAGEQPDVALGMGMETPVDYAMRGATANLSGFPGFQDVAKRFNPGVMRSYEYAGGTYALPETQMFTSLFYRTDILDQLGLKPPQTWDDVVRMLPALQENGMSFYYPTMEYVMPFYQHGAEFYTSDGKRANLEDATSLAAFKQWTDLFRTFNLPKDVPAFFNHFRVGDMPIGIGDFNTYLQLTVAAPEIRGRWKLAPLPGLKQADGSIIRWSQQATTAAMIMEKSRKKEQAWKFLDWWTSTAVQGQFANDIESLAGIEYRWNTANVEAMKLLPWPDEDVAALAEQSRWAKNVPLVPGYYFLGREMNFAWNNAVLSGGVPPKEALDDASLSLQREMTRKQKDLGLAPDTDLKIKPYDLPFEGTGFVRKEGDHR